MLIAHSSLILGAEPLAIYFVLIPTIPVGECTLTWLTSPLDNSFETSASVERHMSTPHRSFDVRDVIALIPKSNNAHQQH